MTSKEENLTKRLLSLCDAFFLARALQDSISIAQGIADNRDTTKYSY